MAIGWNFSPYNFGRRKGISDSGVETFRGDRYLHLAKEICQNSLDAISPGEKTVRVEFQHFEISKEDIPGYERYIEVFDQCHEASRTGIKKVRDFFDYSSGLLEKEKISVLRISDFNTRGLTGSKEEKDTPWNDLIKAAGVSNKGGEAGGSFGIGKYAAFACSNLRTIFYSTLDEDGIESSQGVAEVINFMDVDGAEKEGEGYYGTGKKNEPIFQQLKLDPNFNRVQETGTDIYIIGFMEEEDWAESIAYAIIDSFLIAIYNGKLEVAVGDFVINQASLQDVIENKINHNKTGRRGNSLEFYRVLTSEETVIKTFPLEASGGDHLGEFEVYLLIDNDLKSRRILMSRINGMKIFEQDRMPGGIPFSGICILQDEKINEYFRKMETPEHDAWKSDQFSENPRENKRANETRLALVRMIRDELSSLATETPLDETDVGDLGVLLPDLEDDLLGSKGKKESLPDENTKSEISIRIEPNRKIEEPPVYVESPGEGGFDPRGLGKGGGHSSYRDGREGKGRQRVTANFLNIRMFQIDNSQYRMVLKSRKDLEGAELRLSVVGEDKRSRLDIGIKNAVDKTNARELKIRNEKIFLGDIEENEQVVIDFQPDIMEQLSMEVVVYAD